jgi:hypothetical protein
MIADMERVKVFKYPLPSKLLKVLKKVLLPLS